MLDSLSGFIVELLVSDGEIIVFESMGNVGISCLFRRVLNEVIR